LNESIRYHVDEHIARLIVRGPRQRGIDVTTPLDVNLISAQDKEHLQYAAHGGRLLVTQDVDFLRLHAEGQPHAGIAFFPQGRPSPDILQKLVLLHAVLTATEMLGQVEYL